MGALTNLLTRNHGELARLVLPISIATGFVWTLAAGQPLLDPYRWRTGE
jgi:thymidylate synthase ThyX